MRKMYHGNRYFGVRTGNEIKLYRSGNANVPATIFSGKTAIDDFEKDMQRCRTRDAADILMAETIYAYAANTGIRP